MATTSQVEVACIARADAEYEAPAKPDDIEHFVRTMSSRYSAPPWLFHVLSIILENKEEWEDLGCEKRSEPLPNVLHSFH